MSVAASGRSSVDGYVIECRGARVRAQVRSVAAVITVSGHMNDVNLEAMVGHLCRFTNLQSPLIVDLDVDAVGGAGDGGAIQRLLSIFGAECGRRGIDWVLVMGAADARVPAVDELRVVHADSVDEALGHFVMVIHARRSMSLVPRQGSRADTDETVHPNSADKGATDELARRRARA